MKKSLLLIVAVFQIISVIAQTQTISAKQIDSLTELVLKTFNVPGIAVGVVKDGKLIHAKGYGVANLTTGKKVDENTLFGVASNSKAMTAAVLGQLVDEGKIKWDDRVTDYIPEFKMYDPYVTDAFTIRDLLTHRSGLGLGAGDLMMFPDGSNFTKKDIIHNLRYLKPVSAFRTKYDYDNNLYIVAGEVAERASDIKWEDLVEQRIMKPLGMQKSAASLYRLKDNSNAVRPHAPVNGKLQVLDIDWSESANAAGGIWSNVTDWSKWVIAQMNHGKYGEGLQNKIFSTEVHEETWTPQTVIKAGTAAPYNTHFAAYGLGWFLSDVKGYKQVTHTGGLAGMVTQVVMFPELQLGIIVFTNQQSGAAFNAISRTIQDSYLGVSGYDWVKIMKERVDKGEAEAKKIGEDVEKDMQTQLSKAGGKFNFQPYLGTFRDVWFGDIEISMKNGKAWLDCKRSPKLSGEVLPYKGNSLIVRWADRTLDADAYLMFTTDMDGKPSGLTMKAISPLTDFSFDFHDLDLKRIK
ncbi:MAG: serine hydrolase, partial [Sediminibacterium sp.]|jgi:CubicO group peptidase (beta-lactamase class C family)